MEICDKCNSFQTQNKNYRYKCNNCDHQWIKDFPRYISKFTKLCGSCMKNTTFISTSKDWYECSSCKTLKFYRPDEK